MKLFLLVFIFISCNSFSQNIVINPSFEDNLTCPYDAGLMYLCNHWNSFRETPDYFNTCSSNQIIMPPNNYAGFQFPHTGSAYSGMYSAYLLASNAREYIGSNLISTLIIGQKYYVSLFINLGGEVNSYMTTVAINKMGVKFSTVPYSWGAPVPITNSAHVYTDSIITDTINWTKISGSFVADSAYNYIMIGNFFDDSNTEYILIDKDGIMAYYFIDDVCVTTDSLFNENWTGINALYENKNETITIYPNPCFNELNLKFNKEPNAINTLSIIDITGKTILQTKTTENEFVFNTEKLAKGLYLVKQESGDNVLLTKFTKE
ncbi:MAG: T9SS type A sorting domain-containing protein [Bacteroidia bacterium]|nr:T9SS type A sorting domain-containing protein [Bacteroidia bacterium]